MAGSRLGASKSSAEEEVQNKVKEVIIEDPYGDLDPNLDLPEPGAMLREGGPKPTLRRSDSKLKDFRLLLKQKTKKQAKQFQDGIGHPFPFARGVTRSSYFEVLTAGLIMSNCVFIGWQAEQRSMEGAAGAIAMVLDNIFTFAFLVELVFQFLGKGWTAMLLTTENYLDIFLVTLSVLVQWILVPLNFEVTLLRKLTVLRTLRLVRLAKAVRLRPEFKEMWALLKGLTGSLEVLFWTYVMIGIVLYFFAIMATALIGKTFKDSEEAKIYFGDVPKSMFTLFQVMTLDSWNDIMRPLMEVNSGVVFFFILFIAVAVFALMNLVTAVIVESAFSDAKEDEAEAARRVLAAKEEELENLKSLFKDIDLDGSGKLTREELSEATKIFKVKQKLRALDILPKDIDELWEILDDGDGELDADEFVDGISRLRGEAKAKDILRLFRELRILEGSVENIAESLDISGERMTDVKAKMERARADIAAMKRTVGRAKEAVKTASTHQRLRR